MTKSPYNFGSRDALCSPCNLADLKGWYESELRAIKQPAVRQILRILFRNLQEFVKYPERPLLLWRGCARTRSKVVYPAELKQLAKELKSPLDTRRNGPAILAFTAAGGIRPLRTGSKNAWHIHHLYSGKFSVLREDRDASRSKWRSSLYPRRRLSSHPSISGRRLRRVSLLRLAPTSAVLSPL